MGIQGQERAGLPKLAKISAPFLDVLAKRMIAFAGIEGGPYAAKALHACTPKAVLPKHWSLNPAF